MEVTLPIRREVLVDVLKVFFDLTPHFRKVIFQVIRTFELFLLLQTLPN